MSISGIKRRLSTLDPIVVDAAIAVGLTLLVCLQLWLIANFHPGPPVPPGGARFWHPEDHEPTLGAYLLVAAVFLPLVWRRRLPWVAVVASGAAMVLYEALPLPPAPIILGPMIALYSLALYARQRRVSLLTLVVVALGVAVPLLVFSAGVRWIVETASALVLLTAAALLGEAARSRREYVAEYERRAMEAERMREEEARRRTDEERMRISREVHDVVAHSLSIVTVQAGAAAALLDDDPARARESIENVRRTAKQALAELRSMLAVLRTPGTDVPLEPAADISHVSRLVDAVRETGLDISLETTGDLAAVPAFAGVSAYRIIQEALTNIVRHAHASRVAVRVHASADALEVAVQDDGAGAQEIIDTAGHGIAGMRERVEALGGSFSAGTGTQGGFAVTAVIPLERRAR